MDALTVAIELCQNRPDELYAKAFLHFQSIFRTSDADVSKIQLVSYLPERVYSDRRALGCVITGAVMAMFDHREKDRGDWSTVTMAEIPAYVAIMPTELVGQLDEIIIQQAASVGQGLLASDLVMVRTLDWERHDHRKTSRWLRALDKAARVYQGLTRPPMSDPFLRDVKQRALEELRPVVARLQKKFQVQRTRATEAEIMAAFENEVANPDLPWLSDSHNQGRWLAFCRKDPWSFLNCSAAELFDNFAGFVSGHEAPYTRQKFSSPS